MADTLPIVTPARHQPRGLRAVLRRPMFWLPAAVLMLFIAMALLPAPFAGIFGNGDPRACNLADSAAGPRPGHPFGFDLQGCDLWANAVYGAQASITVGVVATLIALGIAIVLGTLAGLRGGVVDWLISRATEVFLGFPFLLAAIVVLNSVGERTVWTVSLVLGVFGWPTMARLMRASVRSIRSSEYVLAARTMGLGPARIISRYVLPNSLSPVFILATIAIGAVIVAESSLTYLGIGLQPPAISWGLQIAAGSRIFQSAPHVLLLPSGFLAATVLSVIVLGDALRAGSDPRRLQ
ncbi:ABC transporter permease [Salinibacterium sp. SYSU T00001]|uniref:ABC transporter permease n=1 Tax=Homoserinimonas sedimenticola TaxID=2986805 RepID=UPI0022360C22|nr:ABC transporter permease [Salinibacterium sedimenticola]MCW4384691.1 ABC transporter permease [Salinibacterium sedimenticola]